MFSLSLISGSTRITDESNRLATKHIQDITLHRFILMKSYSGFRIPICRKLPSKHNQITRRTKSHLGHKHVFVTRSFCRRRNRLGLILQNVFVYKNLHTEQGRKTNREEEISPVRVDPGDLRETSVRIHPVHTSLKTETANTYIKTAN